MTTIPIQDLNPKYTPPTEASIRGIVTLSWPYSSSTRQCAVLLAEPDFRLRNHKGQVRVEFQGASAEAVAKQRLGIGDEVILRLDGAIWAQDGAVTNTPGRSVDGELRFGRRIFMHIIRSGITVDLSVDAPSSPENDSRPHEIAGTPIRKQPVPMRRSLGLADDGRAIYDSPAFTRNLRLSGSSFSSSRFNPFADEDEAEEQPRKKQCISFGLLRQARYIERSPAPEKDALPDSTMLALSSGVGEAQAVEPELESGIGAGRVEPLEGPARKEIFSSSRVADTAMDLDASFRATQLDSSNFIAATIDEKQEQVLSLDAMAPPPLPRLHLPSNEPAHQAQEAVSTESSGTRPMTPKLQAVPNSTLPLLSPFPADLSNVPRHMDAGGADYRASDHREHHLDETSQRDEFARRTREAAQDPFIHEQVKPDPVTQADALYSRDKSSRGSQSQPSPSATNTTVPTSVVQFNEQNHETLVITAQSSQSHDAQTVEHRVQLPWANREHNHTFPQTPDKSQMELGNNHDSHPKSAANSTPQSQREQVMAKTFSSLFGYNKPADPPEAKAERIRTASPSPQTNASFTDSWGFDGTFEGGPQLPVARSLFPTSAVDSHGRAVRKSGTPESELQLATTEPGDVGEEALIGIPVSALQQATIPFQDRDEEVPIASPELDSQLPTDDNANEFVTASSPTAALVQTERSMATPQQSPAWPEQEPINSPESERQRPIEENANHLEATFSPAAGLVDEEQAHIPGAKSAAPTSAQSLSEQPPLTPTGGVIEPGSSSQSEGDEPADEQYEPDTLTSLAGAATQLLPTAVTQSEAGKRSLGTGAAASFAEAENEEDQGSDNSPGIEAEVEPNTSPHQQQFRVIKDEGTGMINDDGESISTTDVSLPLAPPLATDTVVPPELNAAHGALDRLTDARNYDVAEPSPIFPVDGIVEDSQGNALDSATEDKANLRANMFDAVPIPPRSSLQFQRSDREEVLDEVNVDLERNEHADSVMVDVEPLPQLAAEKAVEAVEAEVIELGSSSPVEQSDERSPSRAPEKPGTFVTLEEGMVDTQNDEFMEVAVPDLQSLQTTGVEQYEPAVGESTELAYLEESDEPVDLAAYQQVTSVLPGEVDYADARALPLSPHELGRPFDETHLANSTTRYPDLPMSPSMSQSQEQPSLAPLTQSRIPANAMPPTPQLTQAESGLMASQLDESGLGTTELAEVDREGSPLLSNILNSAVAANEGDLDEAQVERVEGAEQRLRRTDQGKGADAGSEVATTGSAVPESANMQIAQPQESTQLKTHSRKSFRSRLSHVPDVISSWFSPKRSSAASGNENVGAYARAAAPKPTIEESGISSTAAPVTPPPRKQRSNGVLTSTTYFTPLSNLNSRVNMSSQDVLGGGAFDILAVVTEETRAPTRAKRGPRDFHTIFWIADTTLDSHDSIRVQVFRPWKAVLPVAEAGDVILLRSFAVKSRKHQPYLLSTDASAWCVWRFTAAEKADQNAEKPVWARLHIEGSPGQSREEVKGPPVEFGDEERQCAIALRDWWLAGQRNVSGKAKDGDGKLDDSHEVEF